MNQSELLKLGKELLRQEKIEEVEIKARELLEFILKQSREELIINSLEQVSRDKEREYKEKLQQIIQGIPLQYITKKQEFMGLDFYVDENVLIPQPDTETLVEQSLKIIKNIRQNNVGLEQTNATSQNDLSHKENDNRPIQVLDLCTGSGAIAISIAKYAQKNQDFQIEEDIQQENSHYPQSREDNVSIIASDISSKALEIAKKNSIQNKVEEKIQFIQSDMFEGLTNYKFDVIVSNPPYIETSIIPTLSKEVRHEPTLALDGGKDGLKFYKCILENASNYLKPDGYVLFEIGYGQGEKILDLFKNLKKDGKCKLEIVTNKPIRDLGGNDRVMIFRNN